METRPKGKSFWMAPFAAHASRGLIRDQAARRKMMLVSLGVAGGLAVVGSTFLKDVLNPREHPVWFILFWLACAWMTVLAVLLALFDMLAVRAQARAAERELKGLAGDVKRSATADRPNE
jgi:cobalamin synthase